MRNAFMSGANPLPVVLGDNQAVAQPRLFKTGSLGWHYTNKLYVTLPNGQRVRVQAQVVMTVIGSKDWPDEEQPATEGT